MPEIITRGTKGSILNKQEGDDQISHAYRAVAGSLDMEAAGTGEIYNREHLSCTGNTVTITLPDYSDTLTALNQTETGGDTIAWECTLMFSGTGPHTIAVQSGDYLNGVQNGTFTVSTDSTVKVALNSGGSTHGFFITGFYDSEIIRQTDLATWTPVLQGSTVAGSHTYTTQIGRVQQVDSLVYGFATITINTAGSSTGRMQISGLSPVPAANNSNAVTIGNISGFVIGSNVQVIALLGTSGVIDFYTFDPVTGGRADFDASLISNGDQIYVSFTYYV